MTKRALFFTYVFFFFMFFFGFALLGNSNAGARFNWAKQFEPLDLSYYCYTLLFVLLSHFVVFRRYYHAKPVWKLWLAILLLLIFFIGFRYGLEEIIYPALIGYGNYNPDYSFRFYAVDNIYYGSIRIFIGFVLFLFDEMFRNQQRQAALKEQNRKVELNFLQAQMNPHFLFNSLNNIYSLALEKHPATASAVLKLSDMMRYVTYQKEEPVQLQEELNYVNSMLAIEQLRHDHPLNYTIHISPEASVCKLPPLLLIPLIENALKHGDLSDPANPMELRITMRNNQLQIMVRNKIAEVQVLNRGGAGLKNLGRRLELLYPPHHYQLSISEIYPVFTITLQIPAEL